jgi:hypothetical protein
MTTSLPIPIPKSFQYILQLYVFFLFTTVYVRYGNGIQNINIPRIFLEESSQVLAGDRKSDCIIRVTVSYCKLQIYIWIPIKVQYRNALICLRYLLH